MSTLLSPLRNLGWWDNDNPLGDLATKSRNYGGLMYEWPEMVYSFATNTVDALRGNPNAAQRAAREAVQLPEYFVPFGSELLRFAEYATGTTNLNRQAAAKIRGRCSRRRACLDPHRAFRA